MSVWGFDGTGPGGGCQLLGVSCNGRSLTVPVKIQNTYTHTHTHKQGQLGCYISPRQIINVMSELLRSPRYCDSKRNSGGISHVVVSYVVHYRDQPESLLGF